MKWQIFRSTFFLLYKARKQKNLQKPKTYCSLSNAVLGQQAKCSLKCSKEICSKDLQPPSKKNPLALHEMSFVSCFVFCPNLRTHLILLISWISWISTNVGKGVYTQNSYVSQHAFLCHVFHADLSPSLSSLF